MPWVRFELTITASERAKTVHVWDRSANVIGCTNYVKHKIKLRYYMMTHQCIWKRVLIFRIFFSQSVQMSDNKLNWPRPLSYTFFPFNYSHPIESRDSSVGIETGYGLDARGVGFRVAVVSRIFSSPCHPYRFWGPPNLLSNGDLGLFLREG
jgi:hypothetical protein